MLTVAAKASIWQRLAALWLVAVLYGCLGLFGIIFSTISAQPQAPSGQEFARPAMLAAAVIPACPLPLGNAAQPIFDDQRRGSAGGRRPRRKGPRGRAEIEQERRELWQKTPQEIAALVAEYPALLPRDQAEAIGAAYARYSSRYQVSIADQVWTLLKDAVRRRIFVPREFIFFDLAVRGVKNQRQGLDQLRGVLGQKAVQVVLLFATNRLFRKLYRSLEFADQVVKEWGIRCIYVKNGIDTQDKDRWEMLLYAHGTGGVEVTIDFRERSDLDKEAERAKKLYDQDLLESQIAAQLGCGRNYVPKLLKRWHEMHGQPMPDGRKRRATLQKKQLEPTKYEQLAEEAKALWDEGLADIQIAERLGCNPPTVVAAIRYWHDSRGLPVTTHAERRQTLVDRMQDLYEQGQLIRDIARDVGMGARSVTLLLRERFASLGRNLQDGRSRRGGSAADTELS